MRLKYEGRESEWEARVAELEGDLQQLQLEIQKQQHYLREVEKVKVDVECDLSEQNQKLVDQLRKVRPYELNRTIVISWLIIVTLTNQFINAVNY